MIVVGKTFSDELEQLFSQDLAVSKQITMEEWSQRPLMDKVREIFSRLFASWL